VVAGAAAFRELRTRHASAVDAQVLVERIARAEGLDVDRLMAEAERILEAYGRPEG
jgi:hypothetical protein